MSCTIEEARLQYLPSGSINLLFIAEAPPRAIDRFFYFEEVDRCDWLYLSLMRVLFTDVQELEVRELREQKPDYLRRFQERGYFLIDASDHPMPTRATFSKKKSLLRASVDHLVEKARSLSATHTRVVLISKSVHEVCSEPLKAVGLNVINGEMIDFPASGRQHHFARKLRRDLCASDNFLQSTILSLEETVRFFGAGKTQQRSRDRWVVEHFLRTLRVKFFETDIDQPDHDPPDARFAGAEFEIKEIQEPGRRRGDEYKAQLAKARAAVSFDELIEGFTPRSIPIELVYEKIMEQTRQLAEGKYRVEAVRRALDLLFYVNLGMATAWDISDGERPKLDELVNQGWRSVSFLHGTHTACVLFARDSAPEFLRSAQGNLMERSVDQ